MHTIEALEARGLSFAGVGRNLEDARRPVYHTHPKGTVAMISCASSFAKGQEASAQRPDLPGRPGLNPLRFETMHEVTEAQLASLREIAEQLGLEAAAPAADQDGLRLRAVGPVGVPAERHELQPLPRQQSRRGAHHGEPEGHRRHRALDQGGARPGRARAGEPARARAEPENKEIPAEFIPVFAREMIDAGADLVVGHGPHLLRGMEIYKGKPIFYSLGNFIGQNELVPKMPADAYERFRADPDLTPGQVYQKRTNNDTRRLPRRPALLGVGGAGAHL